MEQHIIQFFSNLLGIPYDAAEGGIVVVLILFILYMLKVLLDVIKLLRNADKRDDKQTELEQTLVKFAMQTLSSYNENKEVLKEIGTTINNNTNAIDRVGTVLTNIQGAFTQITDGLDANTSALQEVKNNLIKTSKTSVIIKDVAGNEMIRFVAEPDEEGNLVVSFRSLVESSEQG